MAPKRSWKSDPGEDYRMIIRCRNRRILGVGKGEPAPIMLLGDTRYRFYVLNGTSLGSRSGNQWGPPPSFECPHHPDGHKIDGARLRDAVYRLCRPGKVANIDVHEVEFIS
jgi:hypothetical protein